ncbi:MAG: hypothetical protein IJ859_05950 [Synergistaceae bacterium]|nr:hypothetical protein [Synergistaceae bacterium]
MKKIFAVIFLILLFASRAFAELEDRMNDFENRMGRLETRVERIGEKSERRLILILTVLAAGFAWLTLVATVLAFFRKSESKASKPSVTLAEVQNIVQKLIEENNAKLKLNQEL